MITRVDEREFELFAAGLDAYLATVTGHWQRVLGGYRIIDIAHKVVGVGSVGLRAYVVLLEGSSPDDVIFLQLKQARRSVLGRFVHGTSAWHAHQGQRVVEYQQALQTVSDPLLGWTTVEDRQYYVRQFRNMKGTVPLDAMDHEGLSDYADVVGHLLAKGHARTSGASMIAGYAGKSDRLDDALCRFARLYADQTEADHHELELAVKRGLLPVEHPAAVPVSATEPRLTTGNGPTMPGPPAGPHADQEGHLWPVVHWAAGRRAAGPGPVPRRSSAAVSRPVKVFCWLTW